MKPIKLKEILTAVFFLAQISLPIAHASEPLATELKTGTVLTLKKDLNLNKCAGNTYTTVASRNSRGDYILDDKGNYTYHRRYYHLWSIDLGTGECTDKNENSFSRHCIISSFNETGLGRLPKGNAVVVNQVTASSAGAISIGFSVLGDSDFKGEIFCTRAGFDGRQDPISLASLKYNIREYLKVEDAKEALIRSLSGTVPDSHEPNCSGNL